VPINRYYNMTMKQLCDLKKRKEKKVLTLEQRTYDYMALKEASDIRYHLLLINAEIASRVAQMSLFQ